MFPRIFDRYIGRQIGSATLIGVALLSGVMVLGNVYKKLDQLLGNTELPLSTVLEFVALVVPYSLSFTIPWAFLTGLLLVFGRLSADNELISLRMTGMSMPRICAPVFAMAVALCGLCLWVNAYLAPAAKDRIKRLFYQVAVKNPETLFQEGHVLERVPGFRIFTGSRDGKSLGDLHIIKLSPGDKGDASYIRAKQGEIITTEGKLDFTMLLKDVVIEHLPTQFPAQASALPKPLSMAEFPIEFPLSEMQKDSVRVNASMESTAALDEEVRTGIDTFSGEPLGEALRCESRTEYHKRFSFSLACFTFALVGIPLGVTAQRRETSTGFVLSLITAVVYIVFIIVADTLHDKPNMMPHVIMWAPNAIFLGIGGWLFYKLSRK